MLEDKLNNKIFKVSVSGELDVYICVTCKKHLKRGKMPPMAAANGLKVIPIPEEIELTELENNLFSQRIFLKNKISVTKISNSSNER